MKLPLLGQRPLAEVDVAVVGAGLAALVAALELARRGASVVVVGSGGEAPAHGLGLALLGCGRPYLSVADGIGRAAAQLVWAAGCENHLRLKAFVDAAGGGLGYRARGSFLLARTRAQAEALAESEDLLRDDGFRGEFLDHYMLETRFDMSGSPGAYWAAGDAELDAEALVDAAREAAHAAHVGLLPGAVRALREEASGVHLELESGSLRAGAAVVAPDAAASALVPEVAPLLSCAVSSRLVLEPLVGATLPTALRTADGAIAWQSHDGSLRLADTAGLGEEDGEAQLSEFASRLPLDLGSARALEVPCDASLDGLPVVGQLNDRPLAVACGFSGLAPSFAFAAARWLADALMRGVDPTPEALRATRAPRRLPDV